MEIRFQVPKSEDAYKIGVMLISAIQEQLSGPRHGRWYPVPGNIFYDKATPDQSRAKNYYAKFTGARRKEEIQGGSYQASAPGESPAVRTGRLRQGFVFTVLATHDGQFEVVVRTNVYYADDMQYGTERVAARPFAEQAIKKVMPEILKIREQFFYDIIRKESL